MVVIRQRLRSEADSDSKKSKKSGRRLTAKSSWKLELLRQSAVLTDGSNDLTAPLDDIHQQTRPTGRQPSKALSTLINITVNGTGLQKAARALLGTDNWTGSLQASLAARGTRSGTRVSASDKPSGSKGSSALEACKLLRLLCLTRTKVSCQGHFDGRCMQGVVVRSNEYTTPRARWPWRGRCGGPVSCRCRPWCDPPSLERSPRRRTLRM